MQKFVTSFNHQSFRIDEDYSHKLKNFQLVRPLSLEQQVGRFLAAGEDLKKMMGLGVYDFNEAQPLDDELDDPTRDPDYDLIDAAVQNRDAVLRLRESMAMASELVNKPVQKPRQEQPSAEPAVDDEASHSSETAT